MFISQSRSEQASRYSATVMLRSLAMMPLVRCNWCREASSGRRDRLAVLSKAVSI